MLFLLLPLSAILYSLGFAPHFLAPVGLFGMGLFFWLCTQHNHGAPKHWWQLLLMGVIFSGLHGLFGLLGNPDLYTKGAAPNLWVSLPAYIFAFAGVSGLFVGFFAWVAHRLRHTLSLAAVVFALLFAGRTVLWQFPPWDCPWNPLSAMLAFHEAPLQIVAYISGMGLDFLLALVAVAMFSRPRRVWWPLAVAIVCLIAGTGVHRLMHAPDVELSEEESLRQQPTIRLVQANLTSDDSWLMGESDAHLASYIALSKADAPRAPHTVVWPETPQFTTLLELDDPGEFRDANFLPQQSLLLNYVRTKKPPVGQAPITTQAQYQALLDDGLYKLHNSLAVLSPDTPTVYAYDKHIPFPFGEGLPRIGKAAELFRPLMAGGAAITPGKGAARVTLPNGDVLLPLICYEAAFPLFVTQQTLRTDAPMPDALLNTANEVWFTNTHMPQQLLAMSRIRAIEIGLPMVRVSNIHGTAIYDGFGRPLATLPPYTADVLDVALPQKLPTTPWLQVAKWWQETF